MSRGEELFKAGAGENLSKEERLLAIEYSERAEPCSVSELAQRFQVSERTIYSDLREISKQYKEVSKRQLVVGQLQNSFREVKRELIKGKEASKKGSSIHLKYVKSLWGVVKDMTGFLVDPQLREFSDMEDRIPNEKAQDKEQIEGKKSASELDEPVKTYKLDSRN